MGASMVYFETMEVPTPCEHTHTHTPPDNVDIFTNEKGCKFSP